MRMYDGGTVTLTCQDGYVACTGNLCYCPAAIPDGGDCDYQARGECQYDSVKCVCAGSTWQCASPADMSAAAPADLALDGAITD